jgi:hypothetical protein
MLVTGWLWPVSVNRLSAVSVFQISAPLCPLLVASLLPSRLQAKPLGLVTK